NSSGSTLPPESTATAILPRTSMRPARSAASATAPPGSDHELELAERERDRAADLLVARRDAGADQRAVDLERDAAGRLRHQGIADRARDGVVLLAVSAGERARMAV